MGFLENKAQISLRVKAICSHIACKKNFFVEAITLCDAARFLKPNEALLTSSVLKAFLGEKSYYSMLMHPKRDTVVKIVSNMFVRQIDKMALLDDVVDNMKHLNGLSRHAKIAVLLNKYFSTNDGRPSQVLWRYYSNERD